MPNIQAARAIVDAHKPTNITCRGVGCVGCCHGPILLDPAEWADIKPHVTRAQRNAARLVAGTIADYRCPLLGDDGRCSVYAVRPLVCRSFNSTVDPRRCYPGQAGRAVPDAESRPTLTKALRVGELDIADAVVLVDEMAAMTDADFVEAR